MTQAHGSLLFAAPLEIRHRIYQQLLGAETHVFLDKGHLQMVPCQGTDDVSHRMPKWDKMCKFDDPVWIRRVESSWGCHWKCEEIYLNGAEGDDRISHMPLLSLLLTSKTMYIDVVQFFSHPTQYVHFTDLETIDCFLSASASSVARSTSDRGRWSIFRSVHNIGLTLRASLRLLGTLYVPYLSKPHMERERGTPPRQFATPEGSGCLRQYEHWKRLWSSLLELPHLQRFSFWLDHNEYYGWDLVNEREILQDLSDVMSGLTKHGVEVCVNLPRLPLDKRSSYREEEYFVGEEPEFCLQRRTRLPWMYADKNVMHEGEPGVKWAVNNENGEIPPEYPKDQISEPNFDWMMFDAMGWDMDSKEFERSHMGNQIIHGGNYM
ncbi:hypothetical protein CCHR01_06143 [Colletotrichum chrysophilum]|uniref:Uncharacterized protein n=1 Tax=Colletotrichum chrysophilum TaxID=1836956 RepID=A0AAD9EK23_9PEZI|nr:hypothetical protein CCHR01_06143 [Colletotrichum chrysophilum]